MSNKNAIEVTGLTKIYPPDLRAVDGLDLSVREGEILALLGPNGAGKSTTIRVLSTLSGFDSGKAYVGGIDVDTDPEAVRRTIGVVAQKTGVDHFLTGRENMTIQGHMYRMTKPEIRSRIDELAEYFELRDSLDKTVFAYSGGMTRRLDIATALIHRPKILYLDEPTLGLDIRSRKILWKHIEELNRRFGLTILLTTHYLEEADKLAHRVAIINSGKIRIIGTPDELKNSIHGDSVVLSFDAAGEAERGFAAQLKESGIAREAVWEGNNLHLYVDEGARSIPQIMEQAGPHGVHVNTLSLARPTLDDVFLKYTGTSMLETKEEEGEQWWHQWAGKGGGGGDWKKMAKKWGWEEGQEGEEWQGNEWVDAQGNPRTPAQPDDTPKAPDSAAPAEGGWQGNEWVDEQGRPKGDWGDDPDWKGNAWVDDKGEWKTPPGSGEPPSATGSDPVDPSDTGERTRAADKDDWQGNEWVDEQGRQKGDWGDDPRWKGNAWVDEKGEWRTPPDPANPPAGSWSDSEAGSGSDSDAAGTDDRSGAADEGGWKGNEWVDEHGRPRGDRGKDGKKSDRS